MKEGILSNFLDFIDSLTIDEKLYLVSSVNRNSRSNRMRYESSTGKLEVWCSKEKSFRPIEQEISNSSCSSCKAASDLRQLSYYVEQYRSNTKKVST